MWRAIIEVNILKFLIFFFVKSSEKCFDFLGVEHKSKTLIFLMSGPKKSLV
jgi:hypothetical protein